MHIKAYKFFWVLGVNALLSGCAQQRAIQHNQEYVHYYDRNGDGKIDCEVHSFPGLTDADWELCDDNYDGRYEKRINNSFSHAETAVDLPVPTTAKIDKK